MHNDKQLGYATITEWLYIQCTFTLNKKDARLKNRSLYYNYTFAGTLLYAV